MTRVFNDPAHFKDDMVDGFVAAYQHHVERVPGASGVMIRGGARPGKVSVIIGGGSGHYPAFCGLVGHGIASGAVIGDIFTSPSDEQAYLVGSALNGGAGVLFSYGNYAGDVMNFGQAEQRLRQDGVECRTVLVTDDIASASKGQENQRRGIAGDFCVFKSAGAAADRGDDIDEVQRLANHTNARTRSFGVAFAGCTFPGAERPLFSVDEGRMEIGLGIHGEPGVRGGDQVQAAELAEILVEPLLAERPAAADGRAAVLLNGLGSTKYEELFVLWKDAQRLLTEAGVRIIEPEVGELVTSLDMSGCSLTVCWLDDELEELWTAPADTPAYRKAPAAAWQKWTPPYDKSVVTDTPGWNGTDRSAEYVSDESREIAETVRRCLSAMLTAVEKEEQALGDLDAIAGDGDHGRGMVRGLRAAVAAAADPALGVGSALVAAGTAWGDAGGGASGALWSALLRAIGNHLGNRNPPTARSVAEGVAEGQRAVTRLGNATVGDKCLLDALDPFVHRLDRRLEEGDKLRPAWRSAAEVGTQAANRTAELVPKVGRARPLADKSVGTPDPGAVSLALCLEAVGRALP